VAKKISIFNSKMITIHKYPFDLVSEVEISLPFGHRIIKVGEDPQGTPSMWAIVDTHSVKAINTFYLYYTGERLKIAKLLIPTHASYIATFTIGDTVWHMFD